MIRRPTAYVAGHYSARNGRTVQENVEIARVWAAAINRTGLAWAVLPHNFSTGIESSLSEREWLAFTLEVSQWASGLFLLPGWTTSDGSVGEQMKAELDGRPWVVGDKITNVETSVRALLALIESRK